MSLSDYVKYLRAMKGGVTPWEIAEGCGVQPSEVQTIEVKHRRVGEDDTLIRLARYFQVPLDELTTRRDAFRKRLTHFLDENQSTDNQVTLTLESGEQLVGTVAWYSREAVALRPLEGDEGGTSLLVVQRSWVAAWQNRGTETEG